MNGREVLLGVSGGIAAYKAAALASQLVQAGARVTVAMTHSATQLVAPKTFEALSGRPVLLEMFGPSPHPHIEAAQQAELMCIAPATANILAKAAHGLADDLLSTLLLAFDGPLIMAPAMNCRMWAKPAVQRNVAQLRADGVLFIDRLSPANSLEVKESLAGLEREFEDDFSRGLIQDLPLIAARLAELEQLRT